MLAVALSPLLAALAVAVPPPLFPAMARDLKVGAPLLGQVVTAMLLVGAVLSLGVGPLADRLGMRRPLILGAGAAAACLLGFGLASAYPALIAVALLGGLANATLPGLSLAVAGTAWTGAARQQAIGWASAGAAGAVVVGVPLLTIVSGEVGWRAAFLIGGLLALGAMWFMAAALPFEFPPHATPIRPRALFAAYAPLLRHRPTLRIYGASILRAICWFGMSTYFGAYLGDHLGLDAAWIGVAYSLAGVGYVVGSLIAGQMLARLPARPLIMATHLVLAIAVGLMYAARLGPAGAVALLIVAAFVAAIGWVGIVPLLTETPGGPGTTLVLNGALANLGAAGGGALGGVLLATWTYTALSLGLPVFALAAALLLGGAPHLPSGDVRCRWQGGEVVVVRASSRVTLG